MATNSFLYQAPAGVPGDVSRPDESNLEPAMLVAASTVFAQSYGIPVKYVAGGIQQFNGGAETAADFAGVLCRVAPAISGDTQQSFSADVPYSLVPQGLMVRGYVSVLCAAGTPARGGVVYVQIIANGGVAVGSFRADGTDSGNAIALTATQAEWATDGKDASSISELRIAR